MEKVTYNQLKEKYQQYQNSTNYGLYDVYNSFSREKENAYIYCVNLCDKNNGENLKIVSYCINQFTMGFEFTNDDGKKCFCWITKDYDRFCELPTSDNK